MAGKTSFFMRLFWITAEYPLTMGILEPAPWMEKVPILGQHILMTQLLEGSAVSALSPVLLGLASALMAVACVVITGRLLQHERAVLGH